MPLILSQLESRLREIMDPDYSEFIGFPANNIDTANLWGDIVDDYASEVVPFSTTSSQAKSAFISAMLPISASAQNGIVQLTLAFSSYAGTLSLGMQPIFTGTPPPTPINIAPVVSLGVSGANGEVTSSTLARIIHLWFRTGLATNNSSGVTVNWN